MTAYALVNPDDVIARIRSDIDPTVGTKPGWRWLPIEDDRPSISPTQLLQGPTVTVLADKVTRVWTVREKSAEEVDAEKEGQVLAANALTLAVGFDHENRLRVLEGKAPITLAQFRTALKARL